MYIHTHTGLSRARAARCPPARVGMNTSNDLAFTRYSFTSRLLCTNRPSFHPPRPPALPTLVQYYCTIVGQCKSRLPTSRVYAIHHIILIITISCKCQATIRLFLIVYYHVLSVLSGYISVSVSYCMTHVLDFILCVCVCVCVCSTT